RAPPRAQRRAGPCVPRRVPTGARGRRRARARDGLRLLTRARRRAAADRCGRGRSRPRARLALCQRWLDRELGCRPAPRLRWRLAVRALAPRRPGARPHWRVQVLPPPRARDDRPVGDPQQGLRLPDRDDLPRAARRLSGRGDPDPLRRPGGGWIEDEPGDRGRGDLEGAGAAARCAHGPALSASDAYSWTTAAW